MVKIHHKIISNVELMTRTRQLINNIKLINSNYWVKNKTGFANLFFEHKNMLNCLVFKVPTPKQ
jgi:hypothetical protein